MNQQRKVCEMECFESRVSWTKVWMKVYLGVLLLQLGVHESLNLQMCFAPLLDLKVYLPYLASRSACDLHRKSTAYHSNHRERIWHNCCYLFDCWYRHLECHVANMRKRYDLCYRRSCLACCMQYWLGEDRLEYFCPRDHHASRLKNPFDWYTSLACCHCRSSCWWHPCAQTIIGRLPTTCT